MTADVYTLKLKENFPWHKFQSLAFWKKFVYVKDNAPSHTAKLTIEYLNYLFARYGNLMAISGLNPIEYVWSMIKGKIYSAEKQYNTKDALWDAIVTATKELMVNFLISFYG